MKEETIIKKEKKAVSLTAFDILKASREPLISQGIDIGNFDIYDWLKSNSDLVTEKAIYILWNKGDPVVNVLGGTDVISCLYKDGDRIMGWSR